MSEQTERNKDVVRRLVAEVLNGGCLDVIDDLLAPELVTSARDWISPFRVSFPDVHMEIHDLIAEGNVVAARYTCSATHLHPWLGHAPTGRRFESIDEISIYRFHHGQITDSWGIEDNLERLAQLGLR